MDVCGVVVETGLGAEDWLGRRVVAITTTALGGIAEFALADAVSVFDAPEGLDDAQATAFIMPFHTSHLALFHADACGGARPWWCTRRPVGWALPASNSARRPVPG